MAAYSLPATPPTQTEVVVVDPAADAESNDEGDSNEHAVDPSKAEGPHGKAVSTAAHCPVKGKAHGELVRSIAQDKDATVEDAQEACDAAVETAAAEGEKLTGKDKEKTKPEHSGKTDDAGKPDHSSTANAKTKPTKPKDEVEEGSTETGSDTTDETGGSDEPGNSNGGGPPDKGKP